MTSCSCAVISADTRHANVHNIRDMMTETTFLMEGRGDHRSTMVAEMFMMFYPGSRLRPLACNRRRSVTLEPGNSWTWKKTRLCSCVVLPILQFRVWVHLEQPTFQPNSPVEFQPTVNRVGNIYRPAEKRRMSVVHLPQDARYSGLSQEN